MVEIVVCSSKLVTEERFYVLGGVLSRTEEKCVTVRLCGICFCLMCFSLLNFSPRFIVRLDWMTAVEL